MNEIKCKRLKWVQKRQQYLLLKSKILEMSEWKSQIQAQKTSGIKYIFLIDPPNKAEY